jgi:LPS export ABC transporter protein LptC
MSLKYFSFFLILLIATASIFFQFKNLRKPELTLVTTEDVPDIYAKNIVAVQMSQEGLPEHTLSSIDLVHYPKNNSVHLKDPFVTLYHPGQSPWELSALTSIIYPDLKKVELEGDVRAHQAANTKSVDTTLLTNEATLYTDTKIIESHSPVTMLRPGLRVESIGIRANMKEGEVTLSSNAQVYYNDKKAKSASAQHSAGSKSPKIL